MNTGMQQIQDIIYRQLAQANANVTGGRGKFAKDLAKRIYETLEENGDMNKEIRTQARARGIPEEIIAMCDRVSKAFNFDVMGITEKDQDVYAWLIERNASGQTIEAFAEWAREKERAQYIRKYRNDTGNIRNDWNLAFTTSRSSADEILI